MRNKHTLLLKELFAPPISNLYLIMDVTGIEIRNGDIGLEILKAYTPPMHIVGKQYHSSIEHIFLNNNRIILENLVLEKLVLKYQV